MLVLIDNYDSFTYNVYQYLCELGQDIRVLRNDQTSVDAVAKMRPAGIVISPGPSNPTRAGISNEVIRHFSGKFPLLGICLGHQCIGYVFGGKVIGAPQIMHGKSSLIQPNNQGIFKGLPSPFSAIRYHSLVVAKEGLPDCLQITAQTDDGTIMGLQHRLYPVYGIQFHPESFMTENGKPLLQNFINIIREKEAR